MNTTTRKVRIETANVGQCFATVGIVRDVDTGRKLYEGVERPYNFIAAAVKDAESWAKERGYHIVGTEG